MAAPHGTPRTPAQPATSAKPRARVPPSRSTCWWCRSHERGRDACSGISGPSPGRHFRDVMESKRPLRYDTWTSRRSTSPGASASARPRWRRASRGRPRDGPTPSRASPPPRRAPPRPRSGSASGFREPGPRRLRSRRRCRPRPRRTIRPGSGSAGRAASYDRPGVAGHGPLLKGGVRDRGRRGPDRDRARCLTDDEATELAGAAGGGGGERATLEVTSACGPICGPPSWPIGKADRSDFQ